MKYLQFLIVLFFFSGYSQIEVSGTVTDTNGIPILGANVYIEGTYDGVSTDQEGVFNFETEETGEKTLVITYISFEDKRITADTAALKGLEVQLHEAINQLTGVTLSAGTFEAGDNAKVSVLKPLDIVTTASALGDVVGAFQTLPGTSEVAEDGRLFVRGGQAEETQIFIDGIRVFTPFTPSTNNIPTRGRYSPFLFKGITFSTGGYSAEYGQALSGVLLLNSIDEPDQEKTDVSLMSVGVGLGHTEIWNKSSLSVNTSYINLAPYVELFSDRNDWKKPIESLSGEAIFRQKLKNGLLKIYSSFSHSNFELVQPDINFANGLQFGLKNNNFYTNVSYKGTLGDDWVLNTGGSYTVDNTQLRIEESEIAGKQQSIHLKGRLKKSFSSHININFGTELFKTSFKENFKEEPIDVQTKFDNNIAASFAEVDVFFTNNLAAKAGLRAEYSSLLNEYSLSPRLSFAYKTGEASQFSLAYGDFYQNPNSEYLKFENQLSSEQASHYLLNYQYSKNGRIFRAEAFYKDYDNLVKFDTGIPTLNSDYSNDGFGYASGLDFFWRDNKSVKNLDYWLSYSYLDTKRDHQNFPESATPNFAARHNASIVGKYWIDSWKSQVGITYTFASGRPYTDPNTTDFLASKTKTYNNISLNWAYLISPQKIIYASVNNVLGTKNVFGYNYANTANMEGVFEREAIRPAADQFFFVGFFWTISDDKKSNQLDNL